MTGVRPTRSRHHLDLVFALLSAATLATWAIGGAHASGPHAAAALAAIAWLKCRLVIMEFMGLRSVKLRWRALMLGWLLVVLSLIAAAYWKGLT